MNLKEYLLNKLRGKLAEKKDNGETTIREEEINEIISETEILKAPETKEELIELLETKTKEFFPKSGVWGAGCFHKSKEVYMNNLPCNLRDDKWLAKMFQKHCNLSYINFNDIYEFVQTSDLFQNERYLYEQRIVKWQIEYMMGGGEGWLVDKTCDVDFFNIDSKCDIGFRNSVVKTLRAINLDRDAIEEGIEKNADIWRETYMKRAFRNEFYGKFLINVEEPEKEHEFLWIYMRLYEYYKAHKSSVDRYGIVTPEMKMSKDDVRNLEAYLQEKNSERYAYLEKCKNDPNYQINFYVDFGFEDEKTK